MLRAFVVSILDPVEAVAQRYEEFVAPVHRSLCSEKPPKRKLLSDGHPTCSPEEWSYSNL